MAPSYLRDRAFECVCKTCYLSEIHPRFINAIKSEDNYPVTWGNVTLTPFDLPDVSAAIKRQWRAKEVEYGTNKRQRIYCHHLIVTKHRQETINSRQPGLRLPQTVTRTEHVAVDGKAYSEARRQGQETGECGQYCDIFDPSAYGKVGRCEKCKGMLCTRCGLPLEPARPKEHDDCDPSRLNASLADDSSLVCGVDYQICPNNTCEKRWGLQDGCNNLVCSCLTHFCYLCGARAHHDSDHWRESGCPRWNQPGTSGAHHDEREEVLVIPQHFIDFAQTARAVAELTTNAKARQMKLDEALCTDLLGQVAAREARAEEQRRQNGVRVFWAVDWVVPTQILLALLCGSFANLGDWQEKRNRDGPVGPAFGEAESRNFELARQHVAKAHRKLKKRHPAVYDLLPELDPLVERHLETVTREIEELAVMLVGSGDFFS